jgi:hypothetical protein
MKGKKEEKIEFVDNGYVDGVLMSSEKAYHYYKMIERGLNIMIDNHFVGKMGTESVKRYIEAQQIKIKEGKKIAAKYENGIK